MKGRALSTVISIEPERSARSLNAAPVIAWKNRAGFWLWMGVLAFASLPWCPMSLRWPVRIGVVIALAWAARLAVGQLRALAPQLRRKPLARTLAAFLSAGLAMTLFGPVLKVAEAQRDLSSTVSVDRIHSLRSELEKRGIDLAIVALPEYSHLFPEDRNPDRIPGWLEKYYAAQAAKHSSESGIPTFDLFSVLKSQAPHKTHWNSDQVHLLQETMAAAAKSMAATLESAGLGPGENGERKIVFMGNCFAGQFAAAVRRDLPEWSKTRGLTALGDHGRVADQLFLFPEEYLDDTDLVVWMMHYDLMSSASIPPLAANPKISDDTIRKATIRVQSTLAWKKREAGKLLAKLPYPDALVEVIGTVLTSEDFGLGEEILAIGPGIRDREALALGRIKPGYQIHLNLIPYEAHLARNPKTASAFTVNPSERFDLERFWIHSWTLVR